MGGFQGELKERDRAGTRCRGDPRGVAARAALRPEAVDEVVFGCVLPAGQGQAPARQAAIGAGLPFATGGHHRQQDVRLGHEGGDAGA